MKNIPNKYYLLINLILIALEGIIVLLSKFKILTIGFDLDGRRNINVLLFIIITQLFFLYLVSLSEDKKKFVQMKHETGLQLMVE